MLEEIKKRWEKVDGFNPEPFYREDLLRLTYTKEFIDFAVNAVSDMGKLISEVQNLRRSRRETEEWALEKYMDWTNSALEVGKLRKEVERLREAANADFELTLKNPPEVFYTKGRVVKKGKRPDLIIEE